MFANIEDITLLCGDAKLLYKSRKNGRTQCSPQSLAQQVRDHSLLVRLKICTRGVLSIGAGGRGRGSGVRDMASPWEELSS